MMFCISFVVCFVCFLFRTVFNILHYKKEKPATKAMLSLVYVSMFFLWFSWFNMNFNDPVRMDLPLWLTYSGLGLFVIGVILVVLSHVKIKGAESKRLFTKGIYSKIRHPMYLGFILWLIGFPIFLQSFLTLASSVIWVPQLMLWKILEEKELEKKYREYKKYKKRTWF